MPDKFVDVKCPTCHGSGVVFDDCYACDGSGQSVLEMLGMIDKHCESCGGIGQLVNDCPRCLGTGTIKRRERK